jgi:hypothetical protein
MPTEELIIRCACLPADRLRMTTKSGCFAVGYCIGAGRLKTANREIGAPRKIISRFRVSRLHDQNRLCFFRH